MLTGFNASEIDTLPIWILIAQSFWQEIWRYRHRGRRLAEAMLGHLQVVNTLYFPTYSTRLNEEHIG